MSVSEWARLIPMATSYQEVRREGIAGRWPRSPIDSQGWICDLLRSPMIPLRDENPTTLTPVVTVSLIVLNCLVFLYQLSLGPAESRFILSYAAVPAEWCHAGTVVGDPAVPSALTALTSMFL